MTLVVCIPVEQGPEVPSLEMTAGCGHLVYVSARAFPSYPADARFLCVDCFVEVDDGSSTIELNPVVAAEMIEVLDREGDDA